MKLIEVKSPYMDYFRDNVPMGIWWFCTNYNADNHIYEINYIIISKLLFHYAWVN